MGHILSIDQGTTGTTAFLIDSKNYKVIAKSNSEFQQIYPEPGLVEHNLEDIWDTVKTTVSDVINSSSIDVDSISCIGITNQRETTCAFSKSTGEPLTNAIVWQDRRTVNICNDLKDKNLSPYIKKTTGLTIDPYFSATKIQWMLNNVDSVKQAFKSNDLCFGTIDTYLLYKLTGKKSYFTESTNASRTLLMNLKTGQWDNELLNTFGIESSCLPEIKDSFFEFGHTLGLDFLPDNIVISGILGDQQSALFGQAGLKSGDMKCTYGTGAFMLLNTGENIKFSKSGLLTTVSYSHKGKLHYALEGSSYIAGAAVQWLRDNLNIISDASKSEELALEVTNLDEMKNILFLPFFTGIGSPHWISDAQATITGITRDTKASHITRACLDGICLSINDLITAMENDIGKKISSLKVDGGAVTNNLLMDIQASISNIKIIKPQIIETTAYGAALAAAVGAEQISLDDVLNLWKEDKEFNPNISWTSFYQTKKSQWTSVIDRLYKD